MKDDNVWLQLLDAALTERDAAAIKAALETAQAQGYAQGRADECKYLMDRMVEAVLANRPANDGIARGSEVTVKRTRRAAAQLLIEVNQELGRPVSDELRRMAQDEA